MQKLAEQGRPRRHPESVKGLGRLRYVVEQTFALIHHGRVTSSPGWSALARRWLSP
ncbi:hypothetical protein ACFC4C_33140 [Streptomyces sp. NPDC056039]|uniref:hypothetical protein n=1 Tax=Streptomyces sp. NPDC056039 TaxID=3345687 RepID=UPI0035DEA79A